MCFIFVVNHNESGFMDKKTEVSYKAHKHYGAEALRRATFWRKNQIRMNRKVCIGF